MELSSEAYKQITCFNITTRQASGCKYYKYLSDIFILMVILCLNVNAQNARIIRNVPVLCYHNINSSAEGHSPAYTCTISTFQQHIKMLSDSGYHSITPDELVGYLFGNTTLPERPFVITFDDGHLEHFTVAAPILSQYHFVGLFFIPTCFIGKKNYLSADLIRALSDSGHIVGAHSYDHPDLRHIDASALDIQISEPVIKLEHITHKNVEYFAYPFGAWNDTIITVLRQAGMKGAFQLGGASSKECPEYTIKRMLVSGDWTPAKLIKQMKNISQSTKSLQMVIDLNYSLKK